MSEKSTNKKKRISLEHWNMVALYLMLYDFLAVNGAYFLALWLRFDCQFSKIPQDYLIPWMKFIPIYTIYCLLVFWGLRLYNSLWRFASFSELTRIIESSALTAVFHIVAITVLFKRMPLSYYIIGAGIQFLLVVAVRFSYRFVLLERGRRAKAENEALASRVMLIGAGAAGQMILRDIRGAKEVRERVCCIIDDNQNKWGRYIDGVPIVGGREDILSNAEKYKIEKIFLAIPSASVQERRDILNICKETGCELKNLPGMYEFVNGQVTVRSMKKVDVEDLLGREPIRVNMDEIFRYIKGKVILVTGGGGSIGSELCRQIAAHEPKKLIIFDVYENNAYDIQQELKKNYPSLSLETIIGSVRDSRKLFQVFEEYRPQIVYHAAAHKHVPLMEDSPCEAIKNNAIGTYKTAYAAMTHGCERFVLISTDKAVNPTNIMGASKRLCEMVIQAFDYKIKEGKADEIPQLFTHTMKDASIRKEVQEALKKTKTEFVAVRFGNVLGSNGSVIPLFKKQIEAGGPVTVTHPDIIRYFMTIPEAVSLVLQAGVYAKGGEIFVLDMGEPVRILDLAKNLIRLSGYKVDEDIKIEFTGLRPGEKLYEELLMSEEGLTDTENKLIHIGKPIEFDEAQFYVQLNNLKHAVENECEDVRPLIQEIVPTYVPKKE